jgi:hypothetical protein
LADRVDLLQQLWGQLGAPRIQAFVELGEASDADGFFLEIACCAQLIG